ncbi:conserved hypothetical protein [Trichormus variabilis ATCC 29413]|uniref:TROVE domain-containing protein n=2 Tax=Anabaena variabilis TaxID=264691 RepID=Q3MH59_TRIV2|nr:MULTISPECIES: hypothetical protein [Nostocaceae]ABA19677.1 conserved hypothetical protein [Trichormus variabilis ATCC 29413]MBC1215827.1 hypothetical protein [Trichormus variabilis ARAD]MBC1265970.1 hypothetical protein [Trichormus variabilis FSR]MBC1302244.1 hypothetical protein [Trichormus variabilis N2B]MBC1310283.1 hypothetical protein [Trichormus variabilis PNB]
MTNFNTNRVEQVAREDLVMFINACLACTGQKEFYDDAYGQRVSIDFLHDYILGNYRLLYARTLAAGINHFNQAQIILKLLATGKDTIPEHRQEEGALIAHALNALPPQRAWGVLQQLRQRKINNRRSRAIARDYLSMRRDMSFDAVKYRAKVRAIATHAHLKLQSELGNFLFHNWKQKSYSTQLFEQFRQAHYSAEAIYNLPFTIAEGFAVKHKVPRDVFLSRIQQQMTLGEKLRLQGVAERNETDINVDFGRLPLTKLALYILSLPWQTRQQQRDILHQALERSARLALKKAPLKLGKVAAVLDCSYSSSGSSEKRRRPLGIAMAAHYLLQVAAQEYQAFWTVPVEDSLQVNARGQTDLATPLLAALATGAELIIIISDGCENDPPNGAAEVLRVYRNKLDPMRRTSIIHCNPVFNSDDFSLRTLSPPVPTVGLRDAEDLPTMLNFARFAEGSAPLSELETYLAERVEQLIRGNG